jgi:hypothetical protein
VLQLFPVVASKFQNCGLNENATLCRQGGEWERHIGLPRMTAFSVYIPIGNKPWDRMLSTLL